MDPYSRPPCRSMAMESEATSWQHYGSTTRLLAPGAAPPQFPSRSHGDPRLASMPINGRLWGLRQADDAAIETSRSLGPDTNAWPAPDAVLLQAKRAPAFPLSMGRPGEGDEMRYIPPHYKEAEAALLELRMQHEREQLRMQGRAVMQHGEHERDWQRMLDAQRFRQDELAFQRQLEGRAQQQRQLHQQREQQEHQRVVPHPHGYSAERLPADAFAPRHYEQPRFHQDMIHMPDQPPHWPHEEPQKAVGNRWHATGYDEHRFNEDQLHPIERPNMRLHGEMMPGPAFRMGRFGEGAAPTQMQSFGATQQVWHPSHPMPQHNALSSQEAVAVSLLSLKGATKKKPAFEGSGFGISGGRSVNEVKKGRNRAEDNGKSAARPCTKKQICKVIGCGKLDKGRGLCKLHGGGNRCRYTDCDNASRGSSGLCIRHGGGPRCIVPRCPKSARTVGGYCKMHGGGRKCEVEECKKSARGEGLHCAEHAEKIALQNAHAAAAVSNGKGPAASVARNYLSVYPHDATNVPQSPVTDDDMPSSCSSSFAHLRLGEDAKPSAALKRAHP